MLATHERDAEAYRALLDDLYTAFVGDEDGVTARVEMVLSEYDDVDAQAVIEDAENGAHDDVVAANEDALERSEADDVPSFLVYGDGHYRTTLTGDQEYHVFEKHLEV